MKMTEEQIYEEAKKRVEEKKAFYTHLVVYIIVNAMLVLVWWLTSGNGSRFPWFVFPLGGWGIGLLFHFLGVFVFDRKPTRIAIEKEAEKIRKDLGEPR